VLFHVFNSQEERRAYGGSAFIEIHYYGQELIKPIIEKLIKAKPKDYEILVEWLNKAEEYTGFYILGL